MQSMVALPPAVTEVQPAETVLIPTASVFYASKGVEIEGDDSQGVDVQYW